MKFWSWGLLLVAIQQSQPSSAWYVTPPRQNSEWDAMIKLIVNTFDSPQEGASMAEKMLWSFVEQGVTETFARQQFLRNAKRMRGKKYGVFISKELGQVVGVAEIGISGDVIERRATIGLICVDEKFRQRGMAADLTNQCEHTVAKVWNETAIFAEVEEHNVAALKFFTSRGYVVAREEPVVVKVRRRTSFEERPHLLLKKDLEEHHSDIEANEKE